MIHFISSNVCCLTKRGAASICHDVGDLSSTGHYGASLTKHRHSCNHLSVSKYVKVKPDLKLPTKISGTVEFPDQSFQLHIEAALNEPDRRYEIETLQVIRGTKPNGEKAEAIDGSVLRRVRVAQAFEYLMHQSKDILLEDGTTYELPYRSEWQFDGDKRELWARSTLQVPIHKGEADQIRMLQAARIHAIASAYGVRALLLVSQVLELQQRTASRLIEKAREQGLLDEKAPGNE